MPAGPIRCLVSLIFLLAGAAVTAQEPANSDRDVVQLRTGGFVDGVIVDETPEGLVVEIAPGARIEVARVDVASVKRAQRKGQGQGPAESRPAVKIDEGTTWFLLRNSMGQEVGTRELRIGPEPGNAELLRFEETVTLHDEGNRAIRVHRIEICDRELKPRETLYREITEGDSAVVRATVNNGNLTLETLDDCGRNRFEIPQVGSLTFPLLFQETARRRRLKDGETWDSEVFDPFIRTIARRSARGGSPKAIVVGDEAPAIHQVLTTTARGVESSVWMRGAGDVVREELNGADLVAVRCTEEAARKAAKSRTAQPWIASDAAGRLQVCLPSEDWSFERSTPDAVALTRKGVASSIVATVLDVQAEVTAVGTALVLERRLTQSLVKYQRVGVYEEFRLGALPAVRFEFTSEGEKGTVAGIAIAIRGKKGAGACLLTCPRDEFESDRRDLERLIQRADFRF